MSGQPDWADIIIGVDDPYIRAVLKRVSGQQSSPSVLCSDEAMHLVDRIGLACLLMNDREVCPPNYRPDILADSNSSQTSCTACGANPSTRPRPT